VALLGESNCHSRNSEENTEHSETKADPSVGRVKDEGSIGTLFERIVKVLLKVAESLVCSK